MNLAEHLNINITLAAMNPRRRPRDPDREVIESLMKQGLSPTGRTLRNTNFHHPSKVNQLGMSESRDAMAAFLAGKESDPMRACSLEFQGAMFRVFRRFDGFLVHSHPFRTEVVRRAVRDGYHFTLV